MRMYLEVIAPRTRHPVDWGRLRPQESGRRLPAVAMGESLGYTVTVHGKPVDIYAAQSQYFEGDCSFASFDFSGTVEIHVTLLILKSIRLQTPLARSS